MGSYTFNGRTFSKSICALTQSQASTFKTTYDDLATNHGDGTASSVAGSGIVTYTNPNNNNSTTDEVSLAEIRAALVNKYPTLKPSNNALSVITNNASTTTIIVIISLIGITAAGGYLFLKKREENVQ